MVLKNSRFFKDRRVATLPGNFMLTSLYLTGKNAIVEYLDYHIPVTQLNRDMQAAKRD